MTSLLSLVKMVTRFPGEHADTHPAHELPPVKARLFTKPPNAIVDTTVVHLNVRASVAAMHTVMFNVRKNLAVARGMLANEQSIVKPTFELDWLVATLPLEHDGIELVSKTVFPEPI